MSTALRQTPGCPRDSEIHPENMAAALPGCAVATSPVADERFTTWEHLEAQADRPEVQALIRREIHRGTIRVAPKPGGGGAILIVAGNHPCHIPVSCVPG